jgi:hypothetical protein
MDAARIAAIVLGFLPCTVLAQHPEMGTITVTISDQNGAIIPGAHVVVSGGAKASRSEAISDGSGVAVFHVHQGGYDLDVKARGFWTYREKIFEVTKQTQIAVTLRIAEAGCSCGYPPSLDDYPPVEHSQLVTEIPLIPIEQFVLPARPLSVFAKRPRPKWHWL